MNEVAQLQNLFFFGEPWTYTYFLSSIIIIIFQPLTGSRFFPKKNTEGFSVNLNFSAFLPYFWEIKCCIVIRSWANFKK